MKKSRVPKANPRKTSFEEEEEDELEYYSPEEERDDDYGNEEDEEDEEDEEGEEEEEEAEIKRALANVTFGELQKARSDGSDSVFENPIQRRNLAALTRIGIRPMEASCKKPVGRFMEVVQAPKKELQKQLKKTRNPKVIGELKNHMSWIDQQMKLESTGSTDTKILAEHKKKEREAAKSGKRPFYLKKSEIQKQRLIEKYNNLKACSKLESFLEKRRKNATKDHRHMPYHGPNDVKQQS